MTTPDAIRTVTTRIRQALTRRADLGRGTAVTTVRVQDGFTCSIEDGRWHLTADLSETSGGTAAGPDPGVLGRAALGSCLAICYTRWAALRDLPIDHLTVRIEADYDARGEYGLTDAPPGYDTVRYYVTVASPAPEDAVRRLLDEAEQHTPWLDVFRRPQRLHRTVHCITPV